MTLYDAPRQPMDLTSTRAKLTDTKGNIVETKGDRIYIKPYADPPTQYVYLGGDGDTGTYDFVSTPSGPSINVKARVS